MDPQAGDGRAILTPLRGIAAALALIGLLGAPAWCAARHFGADLSGPIAVKRVVDGDTIELATGELVRYIGVNAPEVRRRESDRWIVVNEPFAAAAREFNQRMTEGRRVRLQYDRARRDRYGRLLAYAYVDGKMVNAELLRAGLARAEDYRPNVHFRDLLRAIEDEARRAGRGLWS
jgi:micrococcal nuclease